MKTKKILILSVMAVLIFINNNSSRSEVDNNGYAGETIQYLIKPTGKSEYKNIGTVVLKGKQVSLITLKSKILFIEVMEKIFYDPESLLPYRTERATSGFWVKEYRTEDYDQNNFTVSIKIFKGLKLVKEKIIKANAPIQNVNLLLFYLRKQADFKIGWHFTAVVLEELKLLKVDLKLLSIDEITVPAGKFQAYHFKSVPDKFEIWMDKNTPQVALRIKLKNVIDCFISMKGYSRSQ
ncbi:MAG: hypothetical protein PHC71_00840 [Candidatus Omnitrophica bacterium]|nr:hypothetical protein [Candidatus Omnitrophota bacterium]